MPLIFSVLLSAFLIFTGSSAAVTYFSLVPGGEVCTSVRFGDSGRGEYTMTVSDPGEADDKPWVDNHFTSLLARPDNIVIVPVCFNAIGRSIGESADITMTISTPDGEKTEKFGVCVAEYEDVDIGEGEGNPCDEMADHTDIFSAALTETEQYAEPGETVKYTLRIDSTEQATVKIKRASGEMQITASQSTVDIGGGAKEVELVMTAPGSPGDYDFSVMVAVEGCQIDDCRREASGTLHVKATKKEIEEAGFFLYLTGPKSIKGKTPANYEVKVRNYGAGQKITFSVSTDEGLETNFVTYTTFVEKDGEKTMPLTVLPTTEEKKTYKIKAAAVGEDGQKRSAEAWLTVDEMVADASKKGEDEFIEKYETTGATLDDWEEVDSVTGAVSYQDDEEFKDLIEETTATGPDMTLVIIIGLVAAAVLVAAFFVYRRMQAQGGDESGWGQLTQ